MHCLPVVRELLFQRALHVDMRRVRANDGIEAEVCPQGDHLVWRADPRHHPRCGIPLVAIEQQEGEVLPHPARLVAKVRPTRIEKGLEEVEPRVLVGHFLRLPRDAGDGFRSHAGERIRPAPRDLRQRHHLRGSIVETA